MLLPILMVETTGLLPVEDYAQEVFDNWKGGSKTRDDGVLFVLAIEDRTMRLHLGYGVETYISDSRARRILDVWDDPERQRADRDLEPAERRWVLVNELVVHSWDLRAADDRSGVEGEVFLAAHLLVEVVENARGLEDRSRAHLPGEDL